MKFFPTHRPLIMGIVNVTPDSFSGDGVVTVADAINQARQMVEDGADWLDIGGESSRPGAALVTAEEEIRRVLPVITALRAAALTAPIAIDTTKAAVAQAALDAGANIVNTITALRGDPAMASLVAARGCPVIMMHNRADPARVGNDTRLGTHYQPTENASVTSVIRDLAERTEAAQKAGIAPDKIILDPGLGFGKSVHLNLALIRAVPKIRQLGYPVLLGPSRKSFIGAVLDAPVKARQEGTAATVALAAFLGADIIRVHEVGFMARVARMAAALRDADLA